LFDDDIHRALGRGAIPVNQGGPPDDELVEGTLGEGWLGQDGEAQQKQDNEQAEWSLHAQWVLVPVCWNPGFGL
jgi:hypothetical protein